MRPKPFDYYKPKSLDEALSLLRTVEDAKILAGGQSLLALMKLRLVSPKALIDINGLTELHYIKNHDDGSVAVGALTRHYELEKSDLIKRRYPLLAKAAGEIGDPQIRNLGTVGGSLVHADPSADIPPVILALNGDLVIAGPNGMRNAKAENFFVDFFTTALARDEVLTEIRLPAVRPKTGTAYEKFSRRHGDFAIVNAAATLTLGKDTTCDGASVAMGGVGAKPERAKAVEKELVHQKLTPAKIAEAAEKASDGLNPPSDIHASAEYRREVCKVIVKRTLLSAFGEATNAR